MKKYQAEIITCLIIVGIIIRIVIYQSNKKPEFMFSHKTQVVKNSELKVGAPLVVACNLFQVDVKNVRVAKRHWESYTQLQFNCPFPVNPITVPTHSLKEDPTKDSFKDVTYIYFLENSSCVLRLRGVLFYDFPFAGELENIREAFLKDYSKMPEFAPPHNGGLFYLGQKHLREGSTSCMRLKK